MIYLKIISRKHTLLLQNQILYMNPYKLFFIFIALVCFSSCGEQEEPKGDLSLKMNLIYNGDPLVMFQDYEYPDGRTINFSRFSLYISDLKLDETLISDVEFHNLTESHVDLSGANEGYEWMLRDLPTKEYSQMSLGVGVNEIENAKDPGTFESGHPLAKPGEHWFSWNSFIFLKLEANMDTNGDGIKDLPISLHLGDDDAYRVLTFDENIIITENNITSSKINIDIYELLGGANETYDIETNPQIHSLGQKDAVIELANNISNSIF